MRSCGSRLRTRIPCSKSIHSRRKASRVGNSPAGATGFASGSQSLVDRGRCKDALEYLPTVFTAEDGLARAFSMQHQAEGVACLVANAGNVVLRTIRILAVRQRQAILASELLDHYRLGEVTAFSVGDRKAQDLALPA